jgi:hypothetical protein
MSTLNTTNIKHASSSSNNIILNSDGTSRFGHGVIEQFFSPCDGSTIELRTGDITLGNANSEYHLTTTFTDITGSTITYTPPAGTKQVIYEFQYHTAPVDNDNEFSTRLYLDSDEITDARSAIRSYTSMSNLNQYKWSFNIGGTTSTSTGRVASWTSSKTIKLQACERSTSNEVAMHQTGFHGTSITDVFVRPCIGITAIG